MPSSRDPYSAVSSSRTATIVGSLPRMTVALDPGRLADAGVAQRGHSKRGFVVTPTPVCEPSGGVR